MMNYTGENHWHPKLSFGIFSYLNFNFVEPFCGRSEFFASQIDTTKTIQRDRTNSVMIADPHSDSPICFYNPYLSATEIKF